MFKMQLYKRFFHFSLTFITAIFCCSIVTQAVVRDGQLDSNFVVNPLRIGGSGSIKSFVSSPDGKILVIGGSGSLSGGEANSITRLNADGSFDETFRGRANNEVTNAFILSNGKIIISGNFTQYDGVARNRVARVNSDGSLDIGFNPNLGTQYVQVVAAQSDGKIIINGTFTEIGGVPRNRLARLNSDGSLDLSFEVGGGISNAQVNKGVIQPDGKILLAGSFDSYDGAPRDGIVRINSNGTLDTTFVPQLESGGTNTIFDFNLLDNGKMYVVGEIFSANQIYRLNTDGSIDSSFASQMTSSGRIYAVLAQPDGKVVVGGSFEVIGGSLLYRLARFNSDGSIDTAFSPQAQNSAAGVGVATLELHNNKILVGGDFSTVSGVTRGGIGRLNLDGSFDTSFVGFFGTFTNVNVFQLLPDGKILIGGNFNSIGTNSQNLVARINPDGSVDNTFNLDSSVKNTVTSIAVQPDGKILIGGYSGSSFGGGLAKGIWRVNPNGSLDTSFNAQIGSFESVGTIAVQTDGKILIGGSFTQVNGVTRIKIARLNSDGSVDNAFNPTLGSPGIFVNKIVLQPDGNILVGGGFASVNGSPIANIVRLKPDGTVDTSFNIGNGANNTVSSILVTPTGKIYIGGNFSIFKGVSRNSLVKLNLDGSFDETFKSVKISSSVSSIVELPNRKVLISGSVSTFNGNAPREKIIRLLENGVIDYSFDIGKLTINTSTTISIFQIAVQPDGKILAVGYFDAVDGVNRYGIMRLNVFARPTPAYFDYEGDGKSDISVFRSSNGTWFRLNSYFNQFRAVQFGTDGDKIVPADYDGDYLTDIAVFRPSSGYWFIQQSGDNSFSAIAFGASEDIPVAGDYDGDGKTDIAVFRPSNGTWYLLQSQNGFTAVKFGQTGDLPVAGDYDGDGKSEIAVFRPSNGYWYQLNLSNNVFSPFHFGLDGDIPVPGDFDGDHKIDIAVFRPSNGYWYLSQSSQGFKAIPFGTNGDKPVVADYDGDEKADIAVFRSGNWYILNSSTNIMSSTYFGFATDTALYSQPN